MWKKFKSCHCLRDRNDITFQRQFNGMDIIKTNVKKDIRYSSNSMCNEPSPPPCFVCLSFGAGEQRALCKLIVDARHTFYHYYSAAQCIAILPFKIYN
jgi:hypothetical protein